MRLRAGIYKFYPDILIFHQNRNTCGMKRLNQWCQLTQVMRSRARRKPTTAVRNVKTILYLRTIRGNSSAAALMHVSTITNYHKIKGNNALDCILQITDYLSPKSLQMSIIIGSEVTLTLTQAYCDDVSCLNEHHSRLPQIIVSQWRPTLHTDLTWLTCRLNIGQWIACSF